MTVVPRRYVDDIHQKVVRFLSVYFQQRQDVIEQITTAMM
jgi:hypothetical protein